MRQRILSGLSWRAGVAIAAVALAAGTGATTVHLASDSHADGHAVDASHTTTTTADDDTTTTVEGSSTTTVDEHDADAATTAGGDAAEHPENFGAVVSEDAKDGGVDGQEISDMAHERNDARRAAADHPAADDHGDQADDAGEADDEPRTDPAAEHRQDGADHGDETDD